MFGMSFAPKCFDAWDAQGIAIIMPHRHSVSISIILKERASEKDIHAYHVVPSLAEGDSFMVTPILPYPPRNIMWQFNTFEIPMKQADSVSGRFLVSIRGQPLFCINLCNLLPP